MTGDRFRLAARILAVLLCAAMVGVIVTTDSPEVLPRPSEPPAGLLPVSHWQDLFDDALPGQDAEATRLSLSSDSWDFYTLAYSIDELTNMYEATGERRYADRAVRYVENVIASARLSRTLPTSDFQDDHLGWVSFRNGQSGQEVALFESYLWRYVARLLRVLHGTGLDASPDLRDRYQRILDFTERDIVDKWVGRGADDYVYRSRTHMAAHWAMIGLDLAAVVDDPARRAGYAEIAHAVDRDMPDEPSSLRGQLRLNPDEPAAYWWSDVWGVSGGAAQDVAHGNGVVAYVVEARDLGSTEWTPDDMARFSRALTAFVMRGDGRYPERVDGRGTGNGWIADGFVKLGRYDRTVQAALQDYGVQNTQYWAAMAANAYHLVGRS